MSSTLLNKYLIKKKKDLLDYAKLLESLIKYENNTLWKNKEKFIIYAKEVISKYVDNYYFDNNIHRDNPIEYANDNINSILKSLILYCKEKNELGLLQEKKNETFLLSVIITTSAYLDISTNVIDGNYPDTKAKFKFLLDYFNKTNILKVYLNNNHIISNIFELVRKKRSKEEKFFDSFENDLIYNEYVLNNDSYDVIKHIKLDLNGYDSNLVKKYEEEYYEKYLEISLELLEVKLIKELLTNKEVNKYNVYLEKKVNDNILKEIKDSILNNYVTFKNKEEEK